MVKVFRGSWSSLGFFRDEEHSLGFNVLRIGSYIIMVHSFIGAFQVSLDATWFEMKSFFYWACDFSFGQWTYRISRHKLAGFLCLVIMSFHALILCIVYFTECIWRR